MDHQKVFSEHVRKHFAYLRKEFGFSIAEDQYHKDKFLCVVTYQKKWRNVKLIWDLQDDRFHFRVYRALLRLYNVLEHDYFHIFALVKYHEPDFDISELSDITYYLPDLQVFDQKIAHNAELLRKYGSKILDGEEWFVGRKLVPDVH